MAGDEGNVELWDVESRRELRKLVSPNAAPLHTVRYSPDGSVIAAGGIEDNHVTLWDAVSGRVIAAPIETNPPQLGGAHSISFSPDSRQIAVPGTPGTVGIWEVATGTRVGRPLVFGDANVDEAIFAGDGRSLIASDESGSVSMVDVGTGRPIGQPLSVGDEAAASLDLSPDGRLLAAASFGGSVFVWDLKTGEPYGSPLTVEPSPVNDVAFSPDGQALVTSHLRSAVVWNMSGEQVIGEPLGGPTDLTTDVSFSSDGKWLAAGRFDGSAVVYDTKTRRRTARIDTGSVITAIAFRPAGDSIAVGTIDGKVRFFDRKSGAAVGSRSTGANRRSGRWLSAPMVGCWRWLWTRTVWTGSTASSGRAKYSSGTWTPGFAWGGRSRLAADRCSPWRSARTEGCWPPAATVGGSTCGMWPRRPAMAQPMTVTDDGFMSVAFDPSGRLVAAGGAVGPVRVWRVADQQPAFPPLAGHTGPVTGTAFDPAGSFLATTSAFGGTRLWDPTTGLGYGDELRGSAIPASLRRSIPLPFLGLRSAFSPDGKLLAVAGVNELGMVWDVDPAVWRQRACAIVGRNLSREEWDLYLPSGTPYRATCSEWPTS